MTTFRFLQAKLISRKLWPPGGGAYIAKVKKINQVSDSRAIMALLFLFAKHFYLIDHVAKVQRKYIQANLKSQRSRKRSISQGQEVGQWTVMEG